MTSIAGQCPTCRAYRNAQVMAEHEELLEPTEEEPRARGNLYRIVKCAGCDTIYFQHESVEVYLKNFDLEMDPSLPVADFAEFKEFFRDLERTNPEEYECYEETSYWPIASRARPEWQKLPDDVLIKLLNSVYAALENDDLRVLAAIGMRGVFERASELIGVDPDKAFAKKLDQLLRDGHIGIVEKDNLEVLTEAGSAAAHRGWEPDLSSTKYSCFHHGAFRSKIYSKGRGGKVETFHSTSTETAHARRSRTGSQVDRVSSSKAFKESRLMYVIGQCAQKPISLGRATSALLQTLPAPTREKL